VALWRCGAVALWRCGTRVPKSVSVRTHVCPACGLVVDRDENAARTILAAGQQWAGQARRGRAGSPAGTNRASVGLEPVRSVKPTRTAYSPPCAASQLRLTAGQGGAALGHVSASYAFTNISATACSLKGYASARIAGHEVTVQQVPTAYIWFHIPVNTIELPSHRGAFFAIQTDDVTTSGYTCFTAPATISPPGSSVGFASQTEFTICDGQMFVSPFVENNSELWRASLTSPRPAAA
jgi:hypothetical protein